MDSASEDDAELKNRTEAETLVKSSGKNHSNLLCIRLDLNDLPLELICDTLKGQH